MDHDEDRNDGDGEQPLNFSRRNEETGEIDRDAVLQHRARAEVFASDEEFDGFYGNVSSDESLPNAIIPNTDHAMNNPSFSDPLDSIRNSYDCNDTLSRFLDIDRQSQQENDDVIAKLSAIVLNDESSKCLNSNENASKTPKHSPELVNALDYSMFRENNRSSVEKSRFSSLEPIDYSIKNLKPSAERGEISSLSPQPSTSQHLNFSSHFANAESSQWASDPPLDISSKDLSLENAQSAEARRNSNTSHRTGTHSREISSAPISILRLSNSPSDSFELPYDIYRRNVARTLAHSNASGSNSHWTDRCHRSNKCSSHVKKTSDESSSSNSDIFSLEGRLMRSWEKPSISTQGIFSKEYSHACISSSSKIRKKNATSLSDLPSTYRTSPQRTPPRFSQHPTPAPKSARKLTFVDSDTSSDDSKEKIPTRKVNLVRKFSEKNEPRKKRKPSQFSKSSDNHSTHRKTDNDKIVSENIHLPLSSKTSDEMSSKPKESELVSNVLCSLETMNSAISEAHQSTRKRLISDAKASESDESDVKLKQKKKLKKDDSSDKEIR